MMIKNKFNFVFINLFINLLFNLFLLKNKLNKYFYFFLHFPVPFSTLHVQSRNLNLCASGTPTDDGSPAFIFPPQP